ncbi:uncharacterized protein LOC120846096 [Ixodes scapularis]|uniref:uncharacterized protein LOC120846096 n=1 Tax=Ixodes scapularis TaxID=6945 RepID=UPI001A9ED53D|nr:uncharacterized protein LOC120846096 [Ixodes scapularis]
MLQRIVLTVLLVQTFINGVFSTNLYPNPHKCMQLIREGGSIACSITGEGGYAGMSIQNCWISCNNGSNTFFLPHKSCDRALDVSWWLTYQQLHHNELPPLEYEECDEEFEKRLESWVDNWKTYEKNAKKTLCK